MHKCVIAHARDFAFAMFSKSFLLSSIGVSRIIGIFFLLISLITAPIPFVPILPKPMCSCLSRLQFRSALESLKCKILRFSNPITSSNFLNVCLTLSSVRRSYPAANAWQVSIHTPKRFAGLHFENISVDSPDAPRELSKQKKTL